MSKQIDLTAYSIGNNCVFITCTASWCMPCNKIKPHVLELLPDKVLLNKVIDKEEYQEKYNKFIPFFMIVNDFIDFDNFKILHTIQTSNIEEFKEFFNSIIKKPGYFENLNNDF